jgi:hypothetical protein
MAMSVIIYPRSVQYVPYNKDLSLIIIEICDKLQIRKFAIKIQPDTGGYMKALLFVVVWLQVQLFRLEGRLANRLVKARQIGEGEYFIGYCLPANSFRILRATTFSPMDYYEQAFPRTGELQKLNDMWIVAGPIETFWNPYLDHLMRMDAAEHDNNRSEMFRELLGSGCASFDRLQELWISAQLSEGGNV